MSPGLLGRLFMDDHHLHRNVWWIRDSANPVLPPLKEQVQESSCCMNPFAVRMEDTYRLYYAGADDDGHRRICLATAPIDQPAVWTRHGVVLDRGEDGDFDFNWTVLPHVVKFPDRWHLYYTGNCGKGTGLAQFPGIGLAFSDDGISFTKYDQNPIIAPSHVEGDPDARGMAGGSVIHVRLPGDLTEWRFYYTGCPTLGEDVFLDQQKVVCYAVSQDGIQWEKRGAVLFRNSKRDYVNIAAAGPVVLQEADGSYRMFYSAIGTRWGYYSICYAESEDGIHWSSGNGYGDDLTLGPTGKSWEWQMVAYPSVIQEENRLRLFYCGNGYGETGIGTAVSGSLRATAETGPCRLNVVSALTGDRWSYRIPEGLSCNEGVFKTHHHPIVNWHGPTGEGRLWHEWTTNDTDSAELDRDAQSTELGLTFIQGIWYRVLIDHVEQGLDLKFTAKNISDRTWHHVVGVPCLGHPSDAFRDPDLERTYAVIQDELTLLKDTHRGTGDPRRTHYSIDGEKPIHYCAASFWGELSDTVLSSGSILRISDDGQFTIGTSWERVAEIWDNQDQHGCVHSNFLLGDLAPGETKSVRGRVRCISGSPKDLIELLQW